MTNFSMSLTRRRLRRAGASGSRLASVTAIYTVKFAPGAHAPAPIDEVLIGLARSRRSAILVAESCTANGSAMRFSVVGSVAYVRSRRFCPPPRLAYEQMFPSTNNSKLAQRTLGALRLTRSFLLLEDDYDVDWEVDRNEPAGQIHPHRVPLRGPGKRLRHVATRRAGQTIPARQLCISPVKVAHTATVWRTRKPEDHGPHTACLRTSPGIGGHSEPRRTA
jgi:hypothetical protein